MDRMWDVRARNESRLTSSFLLKPLEEWRHHLPKGEDGLGEGGEVRIREGGKGVREEIAG